MIFLRLIALSGLAFVLLHGCKDDPVPEIPVSLPDSHVNAIFITEDGTKYFATNKGLASFDGNEWTVYYDNPKVTTEAINDLDFEVSPYGPEFWLATDKGVNVATIPIDATSGATTYTKANTQSLFPGQPGLTGDSVFTVRVDNRNVRWYGTHEGLSAFRGNQWPVINMNNHYRPDFFKRYPVTSIDFANDTVYIGTRGGGVARMITATADAISGASPYEIPWSMIPSDNILAVFTDGATQWYGSDEGLAKHIGTEAKENWYLYYESDGLVNNYVQAINKDLSGKMWFGTRGGVSSYDGSAWKSFTETDGLVSNNVLCIAIDIDGSIWFGTDNGVSHFDGTDWKNYQAEK